MPEPVAVPRFYRRPLPEGLVEFGSPEGRVLLRRAMDAGTAESFYPLIANLQTQGEPAWCALGTLVTVLNALEIDPQRPWKGPWRWFGEELFDCCKSLDEVTAHGLTLDEVVTLARCNGAAAERSYAGDGAIEAFRTDLERCTRGTHEFLVAAYHRGGLGQTGEGHYSPIAAFDAESDQVLVLDVARFKYPPHWVPVLLLWEAMRMADPASGHTRGWMTVKPSGSTPCRTDVARMCCKLEDLGASVPDVPGADGIRAS